MTDDRQLAEMNEQLLQEVERILNELHKVYRYRTEDLIILCQATGVMQDRILKH